MGNTAHSSIHNLLTSAPIQQNHTMSQAHPPTLTVCLLRMSYTHNCPAIWSLKLSKHMIRTEKEKKMCSEPSQINQSILFLSLLFIHSQWNRSPDLTLGWISLYCLPPGLHFLFGVHETSSVTLIQGVQLALMVLRFKYPFIQVDHLQWDVQQCWKQLESLNHGSLLWCILGNTWKNR